uniref:Peptidase S1 domain-containing protein n=1 Tax=Panagrolaimus sp. JU765 TaxID=591449 RepID=A0AC34RB67_9BILA
MSSWISVFVAIVAPFLVNANDFCGIAPSVQKYENILNGTDDLPLKIINGRESVNGDWPWLVRLRYTDGVFLYTCTGTIIGQRWILTALHCNFPVGTKILYGDVDCSKANTAIVAETICDVCEFVEDDAQTLKNIDIRLLKLENPLDFNNFTKPICLTRNLDSGPGDYEVAAGWGVNPFTGADRIIAREDKLPVDSLEYCGTDVKNHTFVGQKEICAGTDNIGVTHGDSGGPLMTLKDGKWYQHGITSRGSEPQDHRGVYTDVTKFCDWIEKITEKEVECENDSVF